jgi:hypothetical protein
MLVFCRAIVGLTLFMAVINGIFSFAPWMKFLQLCVVGICYGFFQVSLGLLINRRVKSNISKPVLFFLFIIALAAFIPLQSNWLFIAAVAVSSCLLVLPAIRVWEKMELDPSIL